MTVEKPDAYVATDLEGTLSSGIAYEGMRDYLLVQGYAWRYRRFLLGQLPGLIRYRLGFGDQRRFKERWLLRFLRLFAGFSEEQFAEMAEWVVSQLLWPELRPEVVAELQAHGEKGRVILIVSGLFQPILDVFVRRFSAGKLQVRGLGTLVRFENGLFTGQIEGELNVRQQKVAGLQSLVTNGRLAAAYGESRSGIPMLSLAAEPVAVYPDEHLRQKAEAQGWRILERSG